MDPICQNDHKEKIPYIFRCCCFGLMFLLANRSWCVGLRLKFISKNKRKKEQTIHRPFSIIMWEPLRFWHSRSKQFVKRLYHSKRNWTIELLCECGEPSINLPMFNQSLFIRSIRIYFFYLFLLCVECFFFFCVSTIQWLERNAVN